MQTNKTMTTIESECWATRIANIIIENAQKEVDQDTHKKFDQVLVKLIIVALKQEREIKTLELASTKKILSENRGL